MTVNQPTRRVAALLAVLLTTAACSSEDPSPGYPDQPPVTPAEMNTVDMNYSLEGFNYCSPFNDPIFDQWARRIDLPKPHPTGCTWRGQDINASITLETGRSIVDISNDPAYRAGGRDFDDTAGWRTGILDESRTCDWFISTGSSTPDQLLHIRTQITTDDNPPDAPTSEGRHHACTFADRLSEATRFILRFGRPHWSR